MHRNVWVVLLIALAFAIGFIGCAGEDGAEGPAGPQGETGPPGAGLSEYTYVGGQGEYCAHCHGTTYGEYQGTLHPEAYADLDEDSRSNLYCVECHTTGFDATVAYGDTAIATNDGPNLDGYDNYVGVDTDEAAARRAALEGVQCESCHGPVGEADENTDAFLTKGEISFATIDGDGDTDVSLCAPCHEGQLEEYAESGHGNYHAQLTLEEFNDEFGRESCGACHNSEGFIATVDGSWTWDKALDVSGDEVNFIGCVTCHDPHANPDGNYQLRTVADVDIVYSDVDDPITVSGYGNGQLCMQCHHARRDMDNVAGQIADGYGHFGPHSSPQMDMFAGEGCWEIAGYDYSDSTMAHQSMLTGSGCVSCHMRTEELVHGSLSDHFRHTFEPVAWIDGEEVGNCEVCHTSLTENTFDINGEQTAIVNKMISLANLIDTAASVADETGLDEWLVVAEEGNADMTVAQREALYALVFVYNDGSKGVHNTAYANALLDNAIDYMGQ